MVSSTTSPTTSEPVFYAVSIAHQKASIAIREKFALQEEEISVFLGAIKDTIGIQEAFVLSTCNRTEVYYVHKSNRNSALLKYLFAFKGIHRPEEYSDYFSLYEKEAAILHLFRVAVGLESQVLGEQQVFGQVKAAYQMAVASDMAGTYLHRLLHTLFYTHKRVMQETTLKKGAASMGYNTVKSISALPWTGSNVKILLIGAGKIATDVCRNLREQGFSSVTICNRSTSKAVALAKESGYGLGSFAEHRSTFAAYDIVISTLSTDSEPYYQSEDFDGSRPRLLIDLSSPRSIAEEAGKSRPLMNVDLIGRRIHRTLAERRAAIPAAEQLLLDAVLDFNNWLETHRISPCVKKFKAVLEELRLQALAPYLKQVDEQHQKVMDEASKKIIQKIVQLPVIQLKNACLRGESDTLSDSLNRLFVMGNNK